MTFVHGTIQSASSAIAEVIDPCKKAWKGQQPQYTVGDNGDHADVTETTLLQRLFWSDEDSVDVTKVSITSPCLPSDEKNVAARLASALGPCGSRRTGNRRVL